MTSTNTTPADFDPPIKPRGPRRRNLIILIAAAAVIVLAAAGIAGSAYASQQEAVAAHQAQVKQELQHATTALAGAHKQAAAFEGQLAELVAGKDPSAPADKLAAVAAADKKLAAVLDQTAGTYKTRAAVTKAGEQLQNAVNLAGTALDELGAVIATNTTAAIAADPLADPASVNAVKAASGAVSNTIAVRAESALAGKTTVQKALAALTAAIAAMNTSQAAAAAAAAQQQAQAPATGTGTPSHGSTSRGGSGGGSTSGGGASGGGGGSTGGGGGGGTAPVVDHTPHVTANGAYTPGCNSVYKYQQTTSSGGGIVINVAYPYTYQTFSTDDGWGLKVYACI